MIGYHVTLANLKRMVENEVPGWSARAMERTNEFKRKGKYQEASSIWSEIKVVYMRLQGGDKCGYCERKLEAEEYGKGEQDVEHFRPKKGVRGWKLPDELVKAGVCASDVSSTASGYFLLPYHLFNYCASCKPCNSAIKGNYFPIAGTYRFTGSNPKVLRTEKPLLIFPIGDFDDDPESLIRFHGLSPQPCAADGHERNRALTTIHFFKLDSLNRKNLWRERAMVIVGLFNSLRNISDRTGNQEAARAIVSGFTSARAPHTNCARSFSALFSRDETEAEGIYRLACDFIESAS